MNSQVKNDAKHVEANSIYMLFDSNQDALIAASGAECETTDVEIGGSP